MNFFKGIDFTTYGLSVKSRAVNERRFKDYFGIQYSQDGDFLVDVDGVCRQTVSGAWALITQPGPKFTYGPAPGHSRLHAFVCFKGPRAGEYVKAGLLPLLPKNPLIKITRPERFLETLDQLISLLPPPSEGKYARAVHLLEDLLLQLHEQPAETGRFPEYLRPGFEALVAQLHDNPELQWDFHAEADRMNISYPHFRRLFHQHSGLPPGQFLSRTRLKKAANMLVSGDMQIELLAEQCGFDDSFYFSRQFKKYYHMAPRRYRREFNLH